MAATRAKSPSPFNLVLVLPPKPIPIVLGRGCTSTVGEAETPKQKEDCHKEI